MFVESSKLLFQYLLYKNMLYILYFIFFLSNLDSFIIKPKNFKYDLRANYTKNAVGQKCIDYLGST